MPATATANGSTTSSRKRRWRRSAASSRRRGSAASFLVGRPEGAPFCSGGNFNTGSAIALFFLLRVRLKVLDRSAHVFLDGFELREQAVGVRRTDAVERRRGELRAEPRELAEQLTSGLAQIEAVDPSVVLV